MGLRPDIEARVRAAEESASSTSIDVDRLCRDIDGICESIEEGEIDAIPVEVLEEPSVVNHREDLSRTVRRAKRESDQLVSVNKAFVAVRRR